MSLDCPMGHLWCSASHELRRASRAGASQGSWFYSFTGVDEGVALEQHRDLGFFPSHELRRASRAGASQGSWFFPFTRVEEGIAHTLEERCDGASFPS
jgi:hypothetical protein